MVGDLTALVASVVGALARPFGWPRASLPVAAAALLVAAHQVTLASAGHDLTPLVGPLAFVALAVPMAVLLDRQGFFAGVAQRLNGAGTVGTGLWIMAGLAVAVLNLDAAVVLVTPLYINLAVSRGHDPVGPAFVVALQACLASGVLPVSNLTNLMVAEVTHSTTVSFLTHLAPVSVIASGVGLWAFKRHFGRARADVSKSAATGASSPDHHPTSDLWAGGTVVAVALVGFVGGPYIGIQPPAVALTCDVMLLGLLVRRRRPGSLRPQPLMPLVGLLARSVPIGTVLLAAAIAVTASATAQLLHLTDVLGSTLATGRRGFPSVLVGAAFAAAANLANNLPTTLVTLPTLSHLGACASWPVLVGVDLGPTLVASGSLATLLWLESCRRLGVDVSFAKVSSVGLRVGLPALLAGLAALGLLVAATGCG